MAVVLKDELYKKYSNYVKDYLNRGYIIIPDVHYDATVMYNSKDANDRIVVKFTYCFDRNSLCTVFKIIVTKQNTRESRPYFFDGETLHCDCFYPVKEFHNSRTDVFVSSEEELQQIRNIVKARKQNVYVNNSKIITDIKLQNVPLITQFKIMNRINAIRGFKRATYSNVTKIQLVKVDKNKIYAKVNFELNGKTDSIILR